MSTIQRARVDPATVEWAAGRMLLLVVKSHQAARPIDGSDGNAEQRLTSGVRRQIQKTLAQAIARHPTRWILVSPTDHSSAEQPWFHERNARTGHRPRRERRPW